MMYGLNDAAKIRGYLLINNKYLFLMGIFLLRRGQTSVSLG
jgi:hypothetical protein